MTEKKSSFKNRIISIIALSLVFFSLCCSFGPSEVHAVADDYEIIGYDVDIIVNKNHTYDMKKTMSVDVVGNVESLEIKVPAGSARLIDIDVKDAEFSVSTRDNYKILTITSPDDLTLGPHVYDITYKLEEYADRNTGMDTLYINILPPDWDRPIKELRTKISLPDDFDPELLSVYSGQFGSKDDGKILAASSGNVLVLSSKHLPADYGITLKAELPDGYWNDILDNKWTGDYGIITFALTTLLIILMWLIGGRDPKTVRTVESKPIDGVLPGDLGYLFTGRTRIKDIIALVIRLAIKGSIRISEYAPKKYRLIKLEEPKDEERFVRSIYHTLFDDVYGEDSIDMEDIAPRLRAALKSVSDDIESGYSSDEMLACTDLSRKLRQAAEVVLSLAVGMLPVLADMYLYKGLSYISPVILTVLTFISASLLARMFDMGFELERKEYLIGLAICWAFYLVVLGYSASRIAIAMKSYLKFVMIMVMGILAMVFICYMKARAKGNAALVARLRSLRHFIDSSENKDFAAQMVEDRYYYYEMLPYVYQFSMLEKWAKKFRWLGIPSADWIGVDIEGRSSSYGEKRESTTIETARELNTFVRTIEAEFDEGMLRVMGF